MTKLIANFNFRRKLGNCVLLWRAKGSQEIKSVLLAGVEKKN